MAINKQSIALILYLNLANAVFGHANSGVVTARE